MPENYTGSNRLNQTTKTKRLYLSHFWFDFHETRNILKSFDFYCYKIILEMFLWPKIKIDWLWGIFTSIWNSWKLLFGNFFKFLQKLFWGSLDCLSKEHVQKLCLVKTIIWKSNEHILRHLARWQYNDGSIVFHRVGYKGGLFIRSFFTCKHIIGRENPKTKFSEKIVIV